MDNRLVEAGAATESLEEIAAPVVRDAHEETVLLVGEREVEQTRNDLQRCTPISAEEFAEWDVWAEEMLKNVTNEELKRVNDFIGHVPESRRILAVAIEHVRKPSVRYA